MSETNPRCECRAVMVQCHDEVPSHGITLAMPNGRYFCFPCSEIRRELLDACKRIIAEYADGDISIGAIEDCQAAVKKAGGE